MLLLGEFHGQRSLAGYSPWGCEGSGSTERLTLPLPWWFWVHGVTAAAESLPSCPSLCDPIGPTGLPPPWESPGKNPGGGCPFLLQCMKVKSESEVAQSCTILSDPVDRSPPGSSVPGVFQARALQWGAIAFSITGSQKVQNNLVTEQQQWRFYV